jgi:hypothetical protein
MIFENIYQSSNRLKEFKQRGTLYHITNFIGLYSIFTYDQLKRNTMSLTRNKDMWYFQGCPPQTFFQLVIDGDKLSENYIIYPYADSYTEIGEYSREQKHWSNEDEERIKDPKHTYFNGFWTKFVKKVILNEKRFLSDFKFLGGDRYDETEDVFGNKMPAGFLLNAGEKAEEIGKRFIFLNDYIDLIQQLDKPIMLLNGENPLAFLRSLKDVKF